MADAKKCDKCGKLYQELEEGVYMKHKGEPWCGVFRCYNIVMHEWEYLDLCNNCFHGAVLASGEEK